MQFSCRYSFINPAQWRKPPEELYSRTLEQIAWIDQAGFDRVTFSEHHFTDNEQLPSLLIAAAAVAVLTRRVRIGTNILVLPLHHPVRVAEDAAIVDILCGGRFDLSVAAGYRENEFAGFGMTLAERAGRMEEGVEIIRKCWQDETFDFDGRYYQLSGVRMSPKPVQAGGPSITMGGSSAPAARRAARLADDFAPTHDGLWDIYYEECARLGRKVERKVRPKTRPLFLHVAEDPDRDWEKIAPHARYEASRLGGENKDTSDDALRKIYHVVTPDAAIDLLRTIDQEAPDFTFELVPVLPGMAIDLAQGSLELFAGKVMTGLRSPD